MIPGCTVAEPEKHRSIRSFVLRQGRLTSGQQHALETCWQRFGITPTGSEPLDLDRLFQRSAPRVLEIGFGDGESLATMVQAHPETDFLGIEVHRPGVGRLLMQAKVLKLDNLRVICMDAVDVLTLYIPNACLDRIQIFFPDPWPKKRHHKRRLIQTDFVKLLGQKLKPGAYLHLATDWKHYAQHMLAVLEEQEDFINTARNGGFAARPDYRRLTKFERRGQNLGHEIHDLIFQYRP